MDGEKVSDRSVIIIRPAHHATYSELPDAVPKSPAVKAECLTRTAK